MRDDHLLRWVSRAAVVLNVLAVLYVLAAVLIAGMVIRTMQRLDDRPACPCDAGSQ